jgi:uncharacterized membrane protein YccC
MVATVAGAVVGVFGAWAQTALALPQWLMLVLVSAPLGMLAMQRPSYRLAPVTGAMVLIMGASEKGAVQIGAERLFEIVLGCIVGVLTAHFVLPVRARPVILENAAAFLALLGTLTEAHLARRHETHIDSLNDQARLSLDRIVAAAAEESRERTMHLSAGPDTAPLLRTLRRVRSDVAIIGRVMAVTDAPAIEHTAVAAVLKSHFEALAAFLRRTGEAPGIPALDALIGEIPDTGTLHFALITLRRDLAELDDRLRELAAAERG